MGSIFLFTVSFVEMMVFHFSGVRMKRPGSDDVCLVQSAGFFRQKSRHPQGAGKGPSVRAAVVIGGSLRSAAFVFVGKAMTNKQKRANMIGSGRFMALPSDGLEWTSRLSRGLSGKFRLFEFVLRQKTCVILKAKAVILTQSEAFPCNSLLDRFSAQRLRCAAISSMCRVKNVGGL